MSEQSETYAERSLALAEAEVDFLRGELEASRRLVEELRRSREVWKNRALGRGEAS